MLEIRAIGGNEARVIHWDLPEKCGFQRSARWYDHVPESVIENDNYNLLWDCTVEETMKMGLTGQI